MASINKVILIGNLGRDPEMRAFPSGDQVANITVATTDKWKDKQSGELKSATEWHRVICNGRQAEIAGQHLRKGAKVYIEGSLHTRRWTDKDGLEKHATEIRATHLLMMDSRPDPSQAPAARDNPAARPATPVNTPARQPATAQAKAASGFDDMDDDIPF
jgi:single-strand DNA-binding protein